MMRSFVPNPFNQYSRSSTTLHKLSEYSQGLEPGGWIQFCEMLNALILGQLIPWENRWFQTESLWEIKVLLIRFTIKGS